MHSQANNDLSMRIMKPFYSILILLIVVVGGQCQTLYPKIGVTASINTYQPQYYDAEPGLGFTAGLGYNYPLSKSASLQAEVNYIQKTFRTNYDENTSVQYGEDIYSVHEIRKDRYAVSYLALPVLLKVSIIHPDFFILGGPTLAMGLGGKHKYELHRTSSYLDPLNEEGTGKIKFDDKPAANNKDVHFDNRFDLGVQVGFGALFFKKIQLECRYEFGTVNVNDHIDSKNRCLQVSLSTPIRLKR